MGKKLRQEDVVEIKSMLRDSHTHAEIADRFQVSRTAIGQIARGETWKHVQEPIDSASVAPADVEMAVCDELNIAEAPAAGRLP